MTADLKHSSSPKPQVLVLRAAGTNCDQETVHALQTCGGETTLMHINQLLTGRVRLHPFQILVIPGGFSYGDDISAGKVFANEMRLRLRDQLQRFVEAKKLVIGICNGFQVLVKAGLLPGFEPVDDDQSVTLALNESARFQCEWVGIKSEKSAASWLDSMPSQFELPIAHGEGRFLTLNSQVLDRLKRNKQIVFRYVNNPNGSQEKIAAICNKNGNVIGMMPHPERFFVRYQHPNWPALSERSGAEGLENGDGYWFWEKALTYATQLLN